MSTITSRSGYAAAWAAAVALLLTAPVRAADPSAIALDREPCVTVQAEGAGQIDPTGHRQRVVALATLRDGRRLTELFPYEWTYANPARDNPFFRANAFRTDLPVRIQRPRRPLDPRTVSPLIAFVLEHTGADGHFHGRACTPWSGAEDRTFAGRVSEHQVPERIAHATDDNLVVQIALVQEGAGPITVCAVARNIGKKPVERVRLRWDFKLRSGTVTTPQDWHVSLAPSALPPDASPDALTAMISNGTWSCAPISDDPRLKKRVMDIEQISLTVLGVERAP